MIACRVVVHGTVQGVGYRYAMIDAAAAFRVTGWVRNRRDGTVEALVQGEREAVDQLVAWCRRGPPSARVKEVVSTPVAVDPKLLAFEPRPTE
jgi:acylphosphatase